MASRKKILLPRSSVPGRAPTLNEIEFGEIAINTHDGKAYIKRDQNGEVSIQSIGGEEVDNVYYVSKSGRPGNDGKSLSNSFASLDSAVAVVYAKQGFKFDETTCERDLNLIMDGVRYDMVLGTNYNAITAGQSYKRGNAIKVTDEQLYQTRRSINEERLGMISVPEVKTDLTSKNRVSSAFDEIIEILIGGTASPLEFPDPVVEAQTDANAAAAAIINNKSTIQDAVITWLNDPANNFLNNYDTAKCARDVGLILDAVRRDLLTGSDFWTITAGNSYLRANSAYVLSDQKQATIEAVQFARDQVKALPSVTSDATVDTLFERVIDVLDGTITVPIGNNPNGTISYPASAGTYSETKDLQRQAIGSARSTLISDTTTFISTNFPSLVYDVAACERDTGFLIDGLVADLTYDGNSASRQVALAYFVGTTYQGGAGEETATVAAFNDLATRIKALTNVSDDARVDTLIAITTDAITAGSIDGIPAESEIDTSGYTTTEYDAIENNTIIIQNDVIDFVNDENPTNNFDQHKCERDTGLIVDAIALDLQNNTNYNSITAGLAYQRGNAQKVQSDQLQYTIDSINYLRDQINASGINSDSQTFVTARIKEITELLEESTEYGKTDGDPIFYTGSGSEDTDKRNATNALIANKVFIKRKVLAWIQENYDSLEYDQDKCIRDVGYIVDALAHDILFDGSFATDTNARSYWVGTDLNIESVNDYEDLDGVADVWTNQLGDGEIAASVAAYNQMKTIINGYVTTPTEQGRVNTLITRITDSIQAADGSAIPLVLPSITGESATFYNNRSTLQEQVVFYANSIFPSFSYDQTTCRRDVGYILDALVYDLKYGGNSATSGAMRSYFSIFNNGYADRLGQNEFKATIAAYEQLKSIIATYTVGTDTGNITKIQNLLDIIIHAIEQSSDGSNFQIGDFFGVGNSIYQYNYPTGLAVGYDSLVFPDLVTLGFSVTYPAAYAAFREFNVAASPRLTIIRQSLSVAENQGADTTIFLKSGDYTVNNPIKLPPKVSIIGDALRATTIRPRNVDSDIFWVDNGCYIKEITFRDHQNGAACVAFDPRLDETTGPFITQSPYVQNCTSLTTSGIGMKIDGSKVSGLKSMVLDAFTQFNADGIGVLMKNRAYAQLVSCFTISTSTSIKAESGAQCSITNSNSSFGDYGLVATGGSPSIYDGTLHADYLLNDDVIRVNGITNQDPANYSLNIGDFKTPNYNDAIKFENDSYYYTILNVSDEITQVWETSGNTEEVIISKQNPNAADGFGTSVEISNDDNYMAIGAAEDFSGSVEIYTRSGTSWNYQTELLPQLPFGGGDASHRFGHIVRMNTEGNIIAVADHFVKKSSSVDATTRANGAIQLFTRSGSTWTPDAFFGLTQETTFDRNLGISMDLSDDGTHLAATTKNDTGNGTAGAVYVWSRDSVGVAWSTDSADAYKITLPATGFISGGSEAEVSLSADGTDLLAAWRAPGLNTIYYYQKNQDGEYILNQSIVPKRNFNSTIGSSPKLCLSPDASYFAYGDEFSPVGYFTNSLTDSDNGAPSKYARKQKLNNATFTGSTLTTTDIDADFTEEFETGQTIRIEGVTVPATNYTVDTVAAQTLTVTVAFSTTGTHTNVQIYKQAAGVVETFYFDAGSWVTQDIIEPPVSANLGYNLGSSLDINVRGDLVFAGSSPSGDSAEGHVIERASTSWSRVALIEPQGNYINAGGSSGQNVSVGGTGDYIAIGYPGVELNTGRTFTYSSILPETGSYNLTIAPSLNKDLTKGQRTDFHQRSLISASSHTFEFVGSGTNMFAAIPQNGGIPKKENEIVYDSANSATPNFGLVYFTATDELGDFRIGGELTINREAGTITGTTFDRSLFAVLTPYILALSGE